MDYKQALACVRNRFAGSRQRSPRALLGLASGYAIARDLPKDRELAILELAQRLEREAARAGGKAAALLTRDFGAITR